MGWIRKPAKKYTPEKIKAIKADIAAGMRVKDIAAKHGFTSSEVSAIKQGRFG